MAIYVVGLCLETCAKNIIWDRPNYSIFSTKRPAALDIIFFGDVSNNNGRLDDLPGREEKYDFSSILGPTTNNTPPKNRRRKILSHNAEYLVFSSNYPNIPRF